MDASTKSSSRLDDQKPPVAPAATPSTDTIKVKRVRDEDGADAEIRTTKRQRIGKLPTTPSESQKPDTTTDNTVDVGLVTPKPRIKRRRSSAEDKVQGAAKRHKVEGVETVEKQLSTPAVPIDLTSDEPDSTSEKSSSVHSEVEVEAAGDGGTNDQETQKLDHPWRVDEAGVTRFEQARRHFSREGTAGIDESRLTEDELRALKLVRRLKEEQTETPEQARRRMLNKRKRRTMANPPPVGADGSPKDHIYEKAWITPNRIDTFIRKDKDDVNADQWTEADEAATVEVERDADEWEPPKRKRRVPWLEQNGWDVPAQLELNHGKQAQLFALAEEGLNWKEWSQFTKANPNWREEEKARDEEKKRKRKEKREAEKKKLEEMIRNGEALPESAQRGRRRGKNRGPLPRKKPQKSAAKPEESLQAMGSAKGKEMAVDNPPKMTREASECVPQEGEEDDDGSSAGGDHAAEPEGEFNLDDWVSDEDDDDADDSD
ncbi:hypothetical protein CC79DRAFT_1323692 [Sarocladium strictum]